MGEHATVDERPPIEGAVSKTVYFIAKGPYWLWHRTGDISPALNLAILMVLSITEIALVFIGTSRHWGDAEIAAVLIVIALPKFWMIAAVFMHMGHDPAVFTKTALFPVFFIAVMLFGLAIFQPTDASDLPGWCRPPAFIENLVDDLYT